jgi:NADH-quinone oxidoreductase subunit I
MGLLSKLPLGGVMTGMTITMGRLIQSYRQDIGNRIKDKSLFKPLDNVIAGERASVQNHGLITVEYPEVKLKPPENFRFIPFLIYEPVTDAAGKPIVDAVTKQEEIGVERCTACGICAKVCPPQCIWIVRAVGDDGKPKPKAAEFYIDIDVCMNCGYCAEFCPFDAIKMDNDYELAGYERHVNHIYDLKTLLKSTTYYESIKPTDYSAEEAARQAKEDAKNKKPASAAAKPAVAAASAAQAAVPTMKEPPAVEKGSVN